MAPSHWIDRVRSRRSSEEAQTMAEYAVVLGLIVPAIIVAYALLAGQVAAAYTRVIGFFG